MPNPLFESSRPLFPPAPGRMPTVLKPEVVDFATTGQLLEFKEKLESGALSSLPMLEAKAIGAIYGATTESEIRDIKIILLNNRASD